MAPVRGPFRLVVPIAIAPDHDATVAIVVAMIPATMPAAVVFIEPEPRTVVAVAIVVAVAAHIDAEPLRVGDGRGAHRDGRQSGNCVSELSHGSSSIFCSGKETNAGRARCRNQPGTFLNGRSPAFRIGLFQSNDARSCVSASPMRMKLSAAGIVARLFRCFPAVGRSDGAGAHAADETFGGAEGCVTSVTDRRRGLNYLFDVSNNPSRSQNISNHFGPQT